jgi:hypothetical protein
LYRTYIGDFTKTETFSMALRTPEIPSYRERVALLIMRSGDWVSTGKLHPAGEITLDKMAAKGWIEKDGMNTMYRIKNDGLAALVRPIPDPDRSQPKPSGPKSAD